MSSNPYEAPREMEVVRPPVVPLFRRHINLRQIAVAQKGVVVGLAMGVPALFAIWVVPPELLRYCGATLIAAALLCVASGGFLCAKLYEPTAALGLFVLLLCPPVGLLVLVIINCRATGTLHNFGIEVGFFGARISGVERTTVEVVC